MILLLALAYLLVIWFMAIGVVMFVFFYLLAFGIRAIFWIAGQVIDVLLDRKRQPTPPQAQWSSRR